MRKKLYTLCLLFIGMIQVALAQVPTTPASNITFTSLEGNAFRVNWTSGNGARRIVVMRQGSAVTAVPVNGVDYNPNSAFGSGDAIQPGQFVVFDNTSTLVDVSGLQPGTTYHVAIFEYNGSASSTQYLTSSFAAASQLTLSAPATQVSGIAFSNIIGNSMTVSWTNGNGARRLVVVRQGSAVNANPVDLTFYSAIAAFGSGTQIGTGNYVVYASTGNSVTVTNLQPSTIYHYAIFEYNGFLGPVYLVPGATASVSTLPRPTIAASNITFASLEGNSFRINWTAGNGTRRIIVAREGSAVTAVPTDGLDYNASPVFGNGDAVQPGQFVVYDGVSTFVDLSNFLPATTYHFRIYEYDGSGTTTAYLTSSFASNSQQTLSDPTTQVTNINFTNPAGTSVTVNWTNGNGTRRIVVVRAGSAVNANPVDLTSYNVNPNFGSGSEIGTGNFVVYANTGNSASVVGLQINVTYHFAVYEYNGISGPMYLVPGATASFTTPAQPTIPASGINFNLLDGASIRINWTNGNGARRIIVARQGSAVTAIPVDGTDYAASNVFGNGDAIEAGQFVIYDGTSSFVDLNGLQPATTYHFRIYEYNGTGVNTAYLTSSFGSGSQSTLSPPSTQISGVNFTNVGGSTLRINWTNGNGNGRLVVARQGSAVNADPVQTISYTGNSVFGSGTQIGAGNFTIYRNTGTTANETITNLIPNTTYHFALYDYNGNTGPAYLIPGATSSVTTAPQPTLASSAMTFNLIEGNSLRANWTNGNGQRRIVVVRQGSPVTAVPANGTDYIHNGSFGSGDAILPGQFVVYDGTSTFVDISNLIAGITYHLAIFEYDGTATNTTYLVSSFLSSSQSTLSAPTIQASNLVFSAVAGTTLTAGWTNGNGANRLVVARQNSPVNADPVNFTSYSSSSSFGNGGQVGVGNYVLYSSNSSSIGVTNLISGTTYHFAVYEYNGSSGRVYLIPGLINSITTLGPPQTQATNVSTGTIGTTTMQLTWTNGSGNRRLVLMKQGSAVDASPVNNGTYTANSAFGAGTQVGTGNYAVYNSTGNSVLVTGLTPNTTYHFSVFEFNDFGATSQFLLTNPAIGNATTLSALPVTFIQFTAKNDRNNIRLEWSTAQESNSLRFEVQKNVHNNAHDFLTAGIVNAAGESNVRRDYSYIDEAPLEGTTYYRIKQIDRDGQFMYSKIVSVRYQPKGLIKRVLNPVQEGIFIQLTSFTNNTQNEWILYDMNGRIVHREQFSSQTIYGSTPPLAAGLYILEVRMGSRMERVKITKMN